jgi:putative membrane protein
MALDFKAIKRDFVFYAFFGLGTVAGIVGFAHVIMFFIERYPLWTYLFLAAMILVGLPSIFKKAAESGKLRPVCAIPFTLGAALIIGIFLAEMYGVFGGGTSAAMPAPLLGVYAAFGAVGAMIPGVSGSFILVAFGIYEPVMGAVRELPSINWGVLVPAGIGIVTGLVAGARLALFFLKRWRLMVYSAILGMVAASVVGLVVSTIAQYS